MTGPEAEAVPLIGDVDEDEVSHMLSPNDYQRLPRPSTVRAHVD